MKLIDKDALVAEIERQKKSCEKDGPYWCGRVNSYNDIISMFDNLEVKEVDLEKELQRFNKEITDGNGFFNPLDIAKHFFELGLKAQKGE